VRSEGVCKKGGAVDKMNSFLKASSSKAVLKRAHVDESECGGCEEMGSSLDLKGGDKWMSIVERILSAAAYQTCITSESTKGHLKTNS